MSAESTLAREDAQKVEELLAKFSTGEGVLIPILQEVQEVFGYLSRPVLEYLADRLNIPLSSIYGVATFYSQFHLSPRGKYVIRVCQGTACHVRGAKQVLDTLQESLEIAPGETTSDRRFSLEEVACIGACGLAPAMMVNDETYGRLTKDKVLEIIAKHQN